MARSKPTRLSTIRSDHTPSAAVPAFLPTTARCAGRVESIETGEGFIVVTGWATDAAGQPVDTGLTVEIDAERYPVAGLFPRSDLKAEGVSGEACAFCVDVAHIGTLPRVRLLAGEQELWSSTRHAANARTFRPMASFDQVGCETVSGWVYDPALWHGSRAAQTLKLRVGDRLLPVTVDGCRTDLPFSAAREGRFLGFRVALDAAATADYRIGSDIPVTLVARGDALADAMLHVTAPPAPRPPVQPVGVPDGFIDFHGWSAGLYGWLFGGWIRNDASGGTTLTRALLDCAGETDREVLLLTYPRADVAAIGQGILAFVPGGAGEAVAAGDRIPLRIGDERRLALKISDTAQRLNDLEAVRMVRAIVRDLPHAADNALVEAVSRPVYEGVDTLAPLNRPIFLEVDEIVRGGTDGVMLIGWRVDPTQSIATIRVRSGVLASQPLGERWLTVDRPDIRDTLGRRFDIDHAGFGFQAYAAIPGYDPAQLYLEITLSDGAVAFKPLPVAARAGRGGIVRLLSGMTVAADNVRHMCGKVLGPPVVGMNRERIAASGTPVVMALGTLSPRPRCSVVVPLYGRLDFMMYQMALLSEAGLEEDELVYVLDQPERKTEFLNLARSCHRRFALPARLVLPPENLGFAGASNAGMTAGVGDYVCFLNSDVVPITGDWLDRLVAAMEADPGIGILGAQLLFEDGTLQHGGMAVQRLASFGNMPFPCHPGKGRLPATGDTVRDVPLVTGALMLMRRTLAEELGGFDTDYVVGDFEDADLCMKVRARGLRCAVHDGVRLYHLERQSQGSAAQAWRQNLTLVNACTFAERWDGALADIPVEDELMVLA
ncbi:MULTISPECIES: glycosyltransferase [unclassified Sphingomonas]|uniref:glycosyltransferase n=1 Tax=unclassified Sphingomonas TaxID=196159 RepID=UPI000A64DD26|nr:MULTISPECIES: glycosyltransferase family 2 protein [unclassified Sphingomonas]